MRAAEAVPPSPGAVVQAGLCVGCGSCVAQAGAPVQAAMVMNRDGLLQPAGAPLWWHAPSTVLAHTCPASPAADDETLLAHALFPSAAHADPLVGRFEGAFVGSVAEGDFRAQGSSGGLVTWVAAELLARGLVDGVAHVQPCADPQGQGGSLFRYALSRNVASLRAGAKSRYYPVEMSEVLREIRAVPGRYAVVGIPCFIKAVQLLRRQEPVLRERIAFTLGLFCGHMKSARFIESFARQLGVEPAQVLRADFRRKDPGRPANWYRVALDLRDGRRVERDWFHLAEGDWGAGFFQAGACDFCDDVVAETADISFGDAWVEPYTQDGRGTSVVLTRSPVLHAIVQEAMAQQRLDLQPVDADVVQRTQAAGLRQRREGLSLRLAWRRASQAGLQPRKRVAAARLPLRLRRRLVYRMRAHISRWSHRVYRVAPRLYLHWAKGVLALYQGLAYGRGWVGRWLARVGLGEPQH